MKTRGVGHVRLLVLVVTRTCSEMAKCINPVLVNSVTPFNLWAEFVITVYHSVWAESYSKLITVIKHILFSFS